MKIFKQIVIVFLIGILIAYMLDDRKAKSSDSEDRKDSEVSQDNKTNSNEGEYTGHYCLVCGSPCKKDKQISSSGDALSNYQPYYLCGENMDCVYERERQVNELKNTGNSSSNSGESDCGYCGGDGIEGYGDNQRACPMCKGTGRQTQVVN